MLPRVQSMADWSLADRSRQPLADALQTFVVPCSADGMHFDLSFIYHGAHTSCAAPVDTQLQALHCSPGVESTEASIRIRCELSNRLLQPAD